MKITDTLEQIIEKVEPYMEKDLTKGCLIMHHSWYIEELSWTTNSKLLNHKILWHYGIASLEAFFYNKNIELVDIDDWKRIYIDSDFKKFKLRNVEPYLYTEEENKDLLKLLKELWNKN